MASYDYLENYLKNGLYNNNPIFSSLFGNGVQLGNSVLASDIEAEITKLQMIKAKIDAAVQ